jgi:hypothetical protein
MWSTAQAVGYGKRGNSLSPVRGDIRAARVRPTLLAYGCRPFRGSETHLHAPSPTACAVGHMMPPAMRAFKPVLFILAPGVSEGLEVAFDHICEIADQGRKFLY